MTQTGTTAKFTTGQTVEVNMSYIDARNGQTVDKGLTGTIVRAMVRSGVWHYIVKGDQENTSWISQRRITFA